VALYFLAAAAYCSSDRVPVSHDAGKNSLVGIIYGWLWECAI